MSPTTATCLLLRLIEWVSVTLWGLIQGNSERCTGERHTANISAGSKPIDIWKCFAPMVVICGVYHIAASDQIVQMRFRRFHSHLLHLREIFNLADKTCRMPWEETFHPRQCWSIGPHFAFFLSHPCHNHVTAVLQLVIDLSGSYCLVLSANIGSRFLLGVAYVILFMHKIIVSFPRFVPGSFNIPSQFEDIATVYDACTHSD